MDTPGVRKFIGLGERTADVIVGDLILMEVLMGARDEAHAARISRDLHEYPVVTLAGAVLAEQAARHARMLRALGFTVRTGIDLLIGTFCILHGHALLHDDRDFRPMERHLGLVTL